MMKILSDKAVEKDNIYDKGAEVTESIGRENAAIYAPGTRQLSISACEARLA